MAAPDNLLPELADQLPYAEAAAAQNMEAITNASMPAPGTWQQQFQLVQTPAVPAGVKVTRLRHIVDAWSDIFSPGTACPADNWQPAGTD